jgi:type IV secretion system protein VirB6
MTWAGVLLARLSINNIKRSGAIVPLMPITPFTDLYTFFDSSVTAVLVNGTAKMIALVTPLFAAGFGLYMMLILSSYWRGDDDIIEDMQDFWFRMIGWAAVITFGLNIEMYTTYVAPFVTGLGDDLANTVGTGSGYSSQAALDTMANAFVDSFLRIYKDAQGIKLTIFACIAIVSMSVFGGAFMVIAIAYVILAKLALGILVAVGPLFIAAALFPATRDLFKNWTGQVLNYAFMVMLFSFAAQIEIGMVSTKIPQDLSISSVFYISLVCLGMIFVSLNIPSIAAALAGGIGISTMARKIPKIKIPKMPSMGGKSPPSGGSIQNGKGSSSPQGGSMSAEQK